MFLYLLFSLFYASINIPITNHQVYKYRKELKTEKIVINKIKREVVPSTSYSEGQVDYYFILSNGNKIKSFGNPKKGDTIKKIFFENDIPFKFYDYVEKNYVLKKPSNFSKIPFLILILIYFIPVLIYCYNYHKKIRKNYTIKKSFENSFFNIEVHKLIYYLESYLTLFSSFSLSVLIFIWAYSDFLRVDNDLRYTSSIIFFKILIAIAIPVILNQTVSILKNEKYSIRYYIKLFFKLLPYFVIIYSLFELLYYTDVKDITVNKVLQFIKGNLLGILE